jgi:hypothetical protein
MTLDIGESIGAKLRAKQEPAGGFGGWCRSWLEGGLMACREMSCSLYIIPSLFWLLCGERSEEKTCTAGV